MQTPVTQAQEEKDTDVLWSGIRIYVVDDHPVVREALRLTINKKMGMKVCGEAETASEALVQIPELQPDAVVVDVSLADVHGLDLVKAIRERFPDMGIVVYSMYDEKICAEPALLAGASSYLMKTAPSNEVAEALRVAARGGLYFSREISTKLLKRSVSSNSSNHTHGLSELTEREMTVFKMIGSGLSIIEISSNLRLDRKTSEHYRRRVKEKLDLNSIGELVQYATRWMEAQQ